MPPTEHLVAFVLDAGTVVASLGMAVGFGYYAIGIIAAILVMVTLVALRPIEDRFFPMRHTRRRTDPKPPETDPQ